MNWIEKKTVLCGPWKKNVFLKIEVWFGVTPTPGLEEDQTFYDFFCILPLAIGISWFLGIWIVFLVKLLRRIVSGFHQGGLHLCERDLEEQDHLWTSAFAKLKFWLLWIVSRPQTWLILLFLILYSIQCFFQKLSSDGIFRKKQMFFKFKCCKAWHLKLDS